MAITKVGPKYQITIPKAARKAAGIEIGDLIEATAAREGILLRPKVIVDKHPEVEKRLREGLEDIKKGRVSRPFKSSKAFLRELHRDARRLKKTS